MRKFIRPIRAKLPSERKNAGGQSAATGKNQKDFTDQLKEAPFLSPDLETNLRG